MEGGALPIKVVRCLVCGTEAEVPATVVAEGVISWPHCYCLRCPGHPQMTNGVER